MLSVLQHGPRFFTKISQQPFMCPTFFLEIWPTHIFLIFLYMIHWACLCHLTFEHCHQFIKKHAICFLSVYMDFLFLSISYKCHPMPRAVLCLDFSPWASDFQGSSRGCMHQYSVIFYSQILIPCVALQHFFFIQSSSGGHFCCSHLLDIMNHGAANTHVQVFVWLDIVLSLGSVPLCRIAQSRDNCA